MQPQASPTPPQDLENVKQILNVHFSSPDVIYFEGEAEAVTTVNDKGEFDVLPFHENFIAIVKEKVIIHIKRGGEKKEFPLDAGVLKVEKNKVSILTGFQLLDMNLTPQIEQKVIKPKKRFFFF
jgi:F0F1-type ATP synthase epsilon subunit